MARQERRKLKLLLNLDSDIPRYANLAEALLDAVNAYAADVKAGNLG